MALNSIVTVPMSLSDHRLTLEQTTGVPLKTPSLRVTWSTVLIRDGVSAHDDDVVTCGQRRLEARFIVEDSC